MTGVRLKSYEFRREREAGWHRARAPRVVRRAREPGLPHRPGADRAADAVSAARCPRSPSRAPSASTGRCSSTWRLSASGPTSASTPRGRTYGRPWRLLRPALPRDRSPLPLARARGGGPPAARRPRRLPPDPGRAGSLLHVRVAGHGGGARPRSHHRVLCAGRSTTAKTPTGSSRPSPRSSSPTTRRWGCSASPSASSRACPS